MGDIKQSTAPSSIEKKSKETPTAPLKLKVSLQSQTTVKTVPVKKLPKAPVKTQPTSTPIVKSPVRIRFQLNPSPPLTNSNPSAIKTQKKIPKKTLPPAAPAVEKATRLSLPTADRVRYQSMRFSMLWSGLMLNGRNLHLHQPNLRRIRSPRRVSRSAGWKKRLRRAKVCED